MKILDLVLKGKWYDMIASGEKKEEYREIKPYWEKRLLDYEAIKRDYKMLVFRRFIVGKSVDPLEYLRGFTHVRFHRGYTKITMTFEIESISFGIGKEEWGAEPGKMYFVIKMKNKIEIDHADIVVTHECPNRCKFCIDKFINTNKDVVANEDIRTFLSKVSKIANNGMEVLLLGGEPTVVGVDRLKDIAGIIRNFGFSPIISTNNRDKSIWAELTKIFDWVQITVHSKSDIDFLRPYKSNVNIKIAGDKSFSIDRLHKFQEDTRDFVRKSVSMYFTPNFEELCTDLEVWKLLDTLEWKRNGSYLYAFYDGIRFKRCIHGETNIIDEPTVPKLYPNGHYNKTWCNEDMEDYL